MEIRNRVGQTVDMLLRQMIFFQKMIQLFIDIELSHFDGIFQNRSGTQRRPIQGASYLDNVQINIRRRSPIQPDLFPAIKTTHSRIGIIEKIGMKRFFDLVRLLAT